MQSKRKEMRIRHVVWAMVACLPLGLAIGCKSMPAPCYASPGPVYVSYIDNQTQEFGNLTEPLHTAVKLRLAKVGIQVVGEKRDAYALNVKLYPQKPWPESFSKPVLLSEVSLEDSRGKTVDGPQLFELQPLYREVLTTTTVDRAKRRQEFVDTTARLIVQRFFLRGANPEHYTVIE